MHYGTQFKMDRHFLKAEWDQILMIWKMNHINGIKEWNRKYKKLQILTFHR
jgi:hypothetical protein